MSAEHTTENYIPMDEWPDVTNMVAGFGNPSLEPTARLAGRDVTLRFDDAPQATLQFVDADHVRIDWSEVSAESELTQYRAVEVREGLFLVDAVVLSGPQAKNITFVMDETSGVTTVGLSYMHDQNGTIRTATRFLHGQTTDAPIEPRPHTDALVGKRIYYRYSPTEHYEHIYLSPGTFVWHCVRGGEKGIADADETQAFQLADDLVIFHWREKFLAVESFLIVDFAHTRSIGRMFCWDGPTMAPVHLPFDSEFTVLNTTTYPTAS